MLNNQKIRESFDSFFRQIGLKTENSNADQLAKMEQLVAYLEIIQSQVRKYSSKREITLIESCAGNCYLSFLVYYYFTEINPRKVKIYCIDHNERLMEKCNNKAEAFGFENMYFHAGDVLSFQEGNDPHLVYSLHACDDATDRTIYLGIIKNAKNILSVSCCQHSIKKFFSTKSYKSLTRHRVFKDRLLYMVGDSMRTLLMEMSGYSADVIEFVSSRYTNKNAMIRARKGTPKLKTLAKSEYEELSNEFRIRPKLENYLIESNSVM